MNKRQLKKEFKKTVGFNPEKGTSQIVQRFVIWALNPKRRDATKYAMARYEAERQQVKNIENFNEIMTKRRKVE